MNCATCNLYETGLCNPKTVRNDSIFCELEIHGKSKISARYRNGRVPNVKSGGW